MRAKRIDEIRRGSTPLDSIGAGRNAVSPGWERISRLFPEVNDVITEVSDGIIPIVNDHKETFPNYEKCVQLEDGAVDHIDELVNELHDIVRTADSIVEKSIRITDRVTVGATFSPSNRVAEINWNVSDTGGRTNAVTVYYVFYAPNATPNER